MVFSLSKRTAFRLCVQSKAFLEVRVHWFGRTLICSGPDSCPACQFVRPKSYWYAAATIEKKLEVVEMCDSLARTLIDFHHTLQRPTSEGIVAIGRRPSKRSTWTLEKLECMPHLVKEVPDSVMIDAVSKLYQVPFGRPGMNLRDWFASVKLVHVPLLRNCVINA